MKLNGRLFSLDAIASIFETDIETLKRLNTNHNKLMPHDDYLKTLEELVFAHIERHPAPKIDVNRMPRRTNNKTATRLTQELTTAAWRNGHVLTREELIVELRAKKITFRPESVYNTLSTTLTTLKMMKQG